MDGREAEMPIVETITAAAIAVLRFIVINSICDNQKHT
jgi:hypothetical protein